MSDSDTIYLTDDEDLAQYYAEEAAEEEGHPGDWDIVRIETAQLNQAGLEWDKAAIKEHVSVSGGSKEIADRIAKFVGAADEGDWRFSMWATNSVRYTGSAKFS